MNIYIYSDESGVFDKEHNDYFVFGGLIFLGTEDKENWSRKYSSVERLYFYVDEHTTATNGRYELKEALEQEFRLGTYNYRYDTYYPPIFMKMKDVQLEYCNSKSKLLVRAADIVANKIFFLARNIFSKETNC
jgi:hypothetical protein